MKRAFTLLIFLLLILQVAAAEERQIHEVWGISYDMTLEECRQVLLESKDLLMVSESPRVLTPSEFQSIKFLGYDAFLEIKGYNQISSINLDLSFYDEDNMETTVKYSDKTDANHHIDKFIDAVDVVTESLVAKYGDLTQGVMLIYSDGTNYSGYDFPLENRSLNASLVKSIMSRNPHRIAIAYRIDNITVEIAMGILEEKRHATFDATTKLNIRFLSAADDYAYGGVGGPDGAYPYVKNVVDLDL